ncbi:E3 ubiquitin-protein ligase RHA1B-like [Durio zibethinus]|uniref:E3 ubiquitin-protein ligase RHA1B-like n=1 Tax=Durio zibethinus TaxID=66656 RepID=A0A6P6B7Q6_DURZI|nr:E3 ubiquitin-protein ligase RHA1B-like [Durio zibethinus]
MGFPVGYPELLLPKPLLHTLSFLSYLRKFISTLFLYLGFPDFLEPDIRWRGRAGTDASFSTSSSPTCRPIPVSALLIRELLPVVKFSDLVDPPDSCAVCLYDFKGQDEIRPLRNCRHIFHRSCLDRWMVYDQKTCPLCRTCFVPDNMQETFNERLWAASGFPEILW